MLPPRAHALERADRGLDDHEVHQLAVDELLEWQRPQRAQRLAVEPEGVDRHEHLHKVEDAPDEQSVDWRRLRRRERIAPGDENRSRTGPEARGRRWRS